MTGRDLRMTSPGTRGARIQIVVDGRPVDAYAGESVAAALLAAGLRTFRTTDRAGMPRSYYCGMGICHDCLVTIDEVASVRACMTAVRPGMRVERQPGLRVEEHP